MATRSGYGSFFRFIFWVIVLAFIIAVYFAVKSPGGLPPAPTPDAVTRDFAKFEQKILMLSDARSRGEGTTARFSVDEINAALVKNNAAQTRVALNGNQVTVYYSRTIVSLVLFLQSTGKLGLSRGRLIFTPSEVKLGDLPLPLSWVAPVIQKRLREPDVQEKLRMPDFVSHVEILDGELIVDEFPKRK